MIQELVEFNPEENNERFLVLFFNCIYFNCDFDKSWSLISRKIVFNYETQKKEFSYLVQIKSCCHDLPLLSLWVNQAYLNNSRTRNLIVKFDRYLLMGNNFGYFQEPNIQETKDYCDSIVDELFCDSNNIRISYTDYEWLMRKYDPEHNFFGQKDNVNINNLENTNSF